MAGFSDWIEDLAEDSVEGGAVRRAKTARGGGDNNEWVAKTQELMPVGECAPHVDEAGGVCLTAPTVAAVAAAAGVKPGADAAQTIAAAKAATECSNQHCLLEKTNGALSSAAVDAERLRLKPLGPAATRKWLSNSNIDWSTQQWTQLFPDFHPIPFAMMNFMSYDCALKKFDPAALRDARTFACVLNTDHHPGRGKHWVCVFGDMRTTPWTIEYFNSSGRPPPAELVNWMVDMRQRMRRCAPGGACDDVVVSRRAHQEGDSECGVYCLFYIWSRLHGVPWTAFRENRVADHEVAAFRPRLFVDMRE
jgi:hypothetical protein